MSTADIPSTDGQLLRQYARHNDQPAFAQLLNRHLHWVHSAAQRITRDDALAEDVTQAVFLALSQKAARLARHPSIAAWLFQATQFAARSALQRQRRRKRHEAMSPPPTPPHPDPYWTEIRDHLDHALSRLPATDRQALLLRFYQQMSHAQLAATLAIPEDAARMRVARALAKLRQALGTGSDPLLSAALLAHATTTAPAHLAAAILAGTPTATALALAQGIHGALTILKIKLVGAFTGAILLAMTLGVALQTLLAGTATAPVTATAPNAQPLTLEMRIVSMPTRVFEAAAAQMKLTLAPLASDARGAAAVAQRIQFDASNPEIPAQFLALIHADQNTQTLIKPKLDLMNGQPACLESGHLIDYIKGYKETAGANGGPPQTVPEMATLHAGFRIDATATVDGTGIVTAFHPKVTAFRGLDTLPTTVPAGAQPIQVPRTTVAELQTTLVMPDGGTVMLVAPAPQFWDQVVSTIPGVVQSPDLENTTNSATARQDYTLLYIIHASTAAAPPQQPR